MSEPTVPESDYLHMKAEVAHLTAELAEMTKDRDDWMACQEKSLGRLWVMQENYEAMKAAAEAREKALRAITGEMRDDERVRDWYGKGGLGALTEWERRAGEVT